MVSNERGCLLTSYKYSVDFEINGLRKKVNEVQKEISAKKKVSSNTWDVNFQPAQSIIGKAECR